MKVFPQEERKRRGEVGEGRGKKGRRGEGRKEGPGAPLSFQGHGASDLKTIIHQVPSLKGSNSTDLVTSTLSHGPLGGI
jgi:hypothetical protein